VPLKATGNCHCAPCDELAQWESKQAGEGVCLRGFHVQANPVRYVKGEQTVHFDDVQSRTAFATGGFECDAQDTPVKMTNSLVFAI